MTCLLLWSCLLGKAQVNWLIQDARACTQAEDCALAPGRSCEFGCWIAVNEAEVDNVQQAIDDYETSTGDFCTVTCEPKPDAACISGQCVAVHDVD